MVNNDQDYEVVWEDEVDTVSCLMSFKPTLPTQPPGDDDEADAAPARGKLPSTTASQGSKSTPLVSTALSWNCNGSVLACSYVDIHFLSCSCIWFGIVCFFDLSIESLYRILTSPSE